MSIDQNQTQPMFVAAVRITGIRICARRVEGGLLGSLVHCNIMRQQQLATRLHTSKLACIHAAVQLYCAASRSSVHSAFHQANGQLAPQMPRFNHMILPITIWALKAASACTSIKLQEQPAELRLTGATTAAQISSCRARALTAFSRSSSRKS